MSKALRILLFVLMGISVIFVILFYAGPKEGPVEELYPTYTQPFLIYAYILAAFSVAITVFFSIRQMIINPKNAKKGLGGVLAIVIVVAIAYLLASDQSLNITDEDLLKYNVPSTLKQVGTALISMYLLAGIAIISLIFSGVARIFK